MDELLANRTRLEIEGPHGEVVLRPDDRRSLLLISGGTGTAQAISLALTQTDRHPDVDVLHLACADHEDDFYFKDLLPATENYQRVLIADANRNADNLGLTWLKQDPILESYLDGTHDGKNGRSRIVISGSPPFVYAVTDTLTGRGVPLACLDSDVYAYAPR